SPRVALRATLGGLLRSVAVHPGPARRRSRRGATAPATAPSHATASARSSCLLDEQRAERFSRSRQADADIALARLLERRDLALRQPLEMQHDRLALSLGKPADGAEQPVPVLCFDQPLLDERRRVGEQALFGQVFEAAPPRRERNRAV